MIGDEAAGAVNRSVLVVRPAEPFVRWAAGVWGEAVEDTRKGLQEDHTAYLVPLSDSLELEPQVLKAIWAEIFERELMSWTTEQSRWPARRTLAMFREWFELELCTLAIDLCEEPLAREDD